MRKENRSVFFNAIPVPLTTALNGSSATRTGSFVLIFNRLSKPQELQEICTSGPPTGRCKSVLFPHGSADCRYHDGPFRGTYC